jgi:hypothetical protein
MHRNVGTALISILIFAASPGISRGQPSASPVPAATADTTAKDRGTPAAQAAQPGKAVVKDTGTPVAPEKGAQKSGAKGHEKGQRHAKQGKPAAKPAPQLLQAPTVRPPAVPLVLDDPYFSIWSAADRSTDAATIHWTGKPHPLTSMVRVDRKAFRLLGAEPRQVPALPQTKLRVLPTRTIYDFQNEQVRLTMTFTTPLLPYAVDMLAHPMTFLSWEVTSADRRPHEVEIYYDNQAELVVNTPDQQVAWGREPVVNMTVLRMGSQDQPVLAKKGDNLRIDWGYLYVGALSDETLRAVIAPAAAAREAFAAGRPLPEKDDPRMPRAAGLDWPAMAFVLTPGTTGQEPISRHVMLAYDDRESIVYFQEHLRPFWRRMGGQVSDLFEAAGRDYGQLRKHCQLFDEALMADLETVGRTKYAQIAALAYRQCLAGNKLAADDAGMPLLFPKECFSNGCISTVDVLYPQAPLLLLISPTLAEASLIPILDYACSPRWKFAFAPHDLGTYPMANGQVYGGGEKNDRGQMPVEESGNMLILVAAVAQAQGDAALAQRYWPLLGRWAEFLKAKGLDPENQLCTDDFAGHLAHNVNLSVKAIVALGAYARLCQLTGRSGEAAAYRQTAEEYAARWIKMADDGDHTRLAFDKPGTWSQKYNLVWDRVLGLHLFPPEVARREVAFYKKMQNRYGLPLDNRKDYTKLDWSIWTAGLADNAADFAALAGPVYSFLESTPDRVAMTDWYRTQSPRVQGFRARPVVGGVFLPMLENAAIWKRWVDRAGTVRGCRAPLEIPPPAQP